MGSFCFVFYDGSFLLVFSSGGNLLTLNLNQGTEQRLHFSLYFNQMKRSQTKLSKTFLKNAQSFEIFVLCTWSNPTYRITSNKRPSRVNDPFLRKTI